MLILYSTIVNDINIHKEEGVKGMYYLSGFLNEVRDKLEADKRSKSTVSGFLESREYRDFCRHYDQEWHLEIKPTSKGDPLVNCYFCSLPLLLAAAKYASPSTNIYVLAHGDVVDGLADLPRRDVQVD